MRILIDLEDGNPPIECGPDDVEIVLAYWNAAHGNSADMERVRAWEAMQRQRLETKRARGADPAGLPPDRPPAP